MHENVIWAYLVGSVYCLLIRWSTERAVYAFNDDNRLTDCRLIILCFFFSYVRLPTYIFGTLTVGSFSGGVSFGVCVSSISIVTAALFWSVCCSLRGSLTGLKSSSWLSKGRLPLVSPSTTVGCVGDRFSFTCVCFSLLDCCFFFFFASSFNLFASYSLHADL